MEVQGGGEAGVRDDDAVSRVSVFVWRGESVADVVDRFWDRR